MYDLDPNLRPFFDGVYSNRKPPKIKITKTIPTAYDEQLIGIYNNIPLSKERCYIEMTDYSIKRECDPIVMRSLKTLIKYSMYTTKHIASVSSNMVQSILRGIQGAQYFTTYDMFNSILALDSFSKRIVDTLVYLIYGEDFAKIYRDVKTTVNRKQVNKVLWSISTLEKKDIDLLHKLHVNTDLRYSRKSITVFLRSNRKTPTCYGSKYKATIAREKESRFSLTLKGKAYFTDGDVVVLDELDKEALVCL